MGPHADTTGDALPEGVMISKHLDASGLPMRVSVARGLGDSWEETAAVWFVSEDKSPTYGPGLSTIQPIFVLAGAVQAHISCFATQSLWRRMYWMLGQR